MLRFAMWPSAHQSQVCAARRSLERGPGRCARVGDQAAGVLEARRLYTARVRGGEQDQLRVCRVSGDVGPEPATHEQMQALDGRVERAGRDAGGSTVRILRRQDVDALGAELD